MANIITLLLLTSYFIGHVATNHDGAYLYITNKTSVYRLPLNATDGKYKNNEKPEVIYRGNGFIRALEIDEENQHLYWADFLYNTINRTSLNGTNSFSLFSYAIGYVEGLAIDWSSKILYWTDSLMKMVELSQVDGKHRKVLFKLKGDSEPRGIIADPVNGYLFWTDWGSSPKIERSSLSGENRQTIISADIVWPNDVAVDYTSNRLYWIDANSDKLESANLDGQNRQLQVQLKYHNGIIHPYSMAFLVGKNITYITDWYHDALYEFDHMSSNVTDAKFIFQNSNKDKNIGQVRVTGQHKLNVTKPCLSARNNCSYLCLKSQNNSIKCECPTGMVAVNGVNCTAVERDFEIYFVDSDSESVNHIIKYQDQEGFTVKPLPIPSNESLDYPISLDVHLKSKYIYWTDHQTKKLYRMKENGDDFTVVLQSSMFSADVLAIDQITNAMYLYDSNEKAIIMASLDGTQRKTILNNLELVVDIALHEEKGYLYFSDYSRRLLSRVNTDGSNLITFTSVSLPPRVTGLAVDKIEGRVYFIDDYHYKLESTDLDFNNYKLLVQQTFFARRRFWLIRGRGFVVRPHSLAILHDKIYWTDTFKRAIFEADKRFGTGIEYITGGLDYPRDLHIFSDRITNEKKKMYLFSVIKRGSRAVCYSSRGQCLAQSISDPPPCPSGYTETKFITDCGNTSDTLGANFVCPCDNWHSCAQRTFSNVIGCSNRFTKFIKYAVRECEQVVKPGKCPYNDNDRPNCTMKNDCSSDNDCNGDEKCCKTSCGMMRCRKPAFVDDHPCAVNNGGCSHFCLVTNGGYKCTCPNGMGLKDKQNCVLNEEICRLPKVVGPSQCRFAGKRYYFNTATKQCEVLSYNGCPGNANNFLRKSDCLNTCSGICPQSAVANNACNITGNTCNSNAECPSSRLCCEDKCGTSCKLPVPFDSCRSTSCKNGGMCFSHSATDFYCSCPVNKPHFTGKTCSLDLKKYLVTAKFKKDSTKKQSIEYQSFTKELATRYTSYCSRVRCKFVEETEVIKKRRRRRESPTEPTQIMLTFTEKDIYVDKYDTSNTEVTFAFVLLKPAIELNARTGFLSKESSTAGLNEFGNSFAKTYNLTFEGIDVTPAPKSKKKKSVVTAIVVVMVILLTACVIVIAFYMWRNKMCSVPKKESNVRVSFENQLYNDMNTNDGAAAARYPAEKAGGHHDLNVAQPQELTAAPTELKVPPKDWVQFEEEDIRKSPSDDFVQVADNKISKNWETFDDTDTDQKRDIDGSYDFADYYELRKDDPPPYRSTDQVISNSDTLNNKGVKTIPESGQSYT